MKLAALAILCATATATTAQAQTIDRDLYEVSTPKLEALYATHRYTVTQVVRWHLARIHRYNPMYRSIEQIYEQNALATAASLDRQSQQKGFHPGPLFGVPILIKANTSIAGLVTTDGWKGYLLPGKELVAPQDATIVARLRAAGAVILGHTNMPDFAASDTNRSSSFGRTGNAYDIRFSPGGSSGGTVTSITSNEAVFGNGTDTGNSIRMPAATSSVVGLFPTRGLVSIAGIAPLDWLLDNTGPIARDVTTAAIALTIMSGAQSGTPTPDPADPRTADAPTKAQPGPYTQYLKPDALKGKRFGVPAFVLSGAGVPFQGICPESEALFAADRKAAEIPFDPTTRAAFLASLEGLRRAGATIVTDPEILPDSFADLASHICTLPYIRQGTDHFLATYGPPQYHSAADYQKATGSPLPGTILNGTDSGGPPRKDHAPILEATLETDPNAEATYRKPYRETLAAYTAALDRFHLDGLVYPATQIPPPDETMAQANEPGNLSGGPHSNTSWVNMIGVPAIVLPGSFYASGLPFGLEISTRPWHDGDLLGFAYAYEQATHHRHPPILIEQGLLPNAR
jgi:amidase